MAKTKAQANRAIRQEALREQLANQGHVQHIVDNLVKMKELDAKSESFSNELNKYKTINDQKFKLLNKYLPDLKSTEITGDGGDQLVITWRTVEDDAD